MKKQHIRISRILATMLAIVMSFYLTVPAHAASPAPTTEDTSSLPILATALSEEELKAILPGIAETFSTLHLSTDSLQVEAGKYYEIEVLPAESAMPLGWQITKIELSNSQLGTVCKDVPTGVEVISTTASPTIPERDTSHGTPTGLANPEFFEPELNETAQEDQDQTQDQSSKLSFVIKALRTGHLEFRVTLSNPVWQIFGADHQFDIKTLSSATFVVVPATYHDRVYSYSNSTGSLTVNPDPDVPVEPENPEEPSQPTEPAPVDPIDPTPSEPSEPSPELKEFDTSNWLFDPLSLHFVYDGEAHLPILTGVPEGVELTMSTLGEVNAGSYTLTVGVKVPEGYKPVPDFAVNFEIEKAHVQSTQVYDRTTGTIAPVITGIASGDLADVNTFVNGANSTTGSNPVDVSKPGSYTVSTTIKIDEDKLGNYTFDGADTKTTLVNVKSDQPWFTIDTKASEENGQIVVSFRLENLKTEHVGSTKPVGLEFRLDYDRDRLEYVKTNDESGYWHMFFTDTTDKEYGYYYGYTGPVPESSSICTLHFNVKDGASADDLIVAVRDAKLTAAPINGSQMNFIYKTADSAIVVNPTGAIVVENTTVAGDPMSDVEYRAEHKLTNPDGSVNEAEVAIKEAEMEKLQDYVNQHFQTSPTISSTETPDETEKTTETAGSEEAKETPEKEISTEISFQPIADDEPVSDPQPAEDPIEEPAADESSKAVNNGSDKSSNVKTDDQASVVIPEHSEPVVERPDLKLEPNDVVVTEREASSIDNSAAQTEEANEPSAADSDDTVAESTASTEDVTSSEPAAVAE